MSKLTEAGFNVPKAFIVLPRLFDTALTDADVRDECQDVFKLYHTGKLDSRGCAKELQRLFTTNNFLRHVHKAIETHLRGQTADTILWIVRTSFLLEDSESASLAGFFVSKKNVFGPNIVDAILDCWTSIFKERIIEWARDNDVSLLPSRASIIIQEMIQCDYEGVTFMIDPRYPNKTNGVLEYSAQGRGNVVSGQGEINRTTFRKKANQLVAWPNGHYEHSGPLADQCICNILSTCAGIEALFDCPQDIEWGIANNVTYIFRG